MKFGIVSCEIEFIINWVWLNFCVFLRCGYVSQTLIWLALVYKIMIHILNSRKFDMLTRKNIESDSGKRE